MPKLKMAFGLCVLLAACMQNIVETKTPFDPNAGRYILAKGSGAIEGQAFMRQAGGDVVTCAGEEVTLIPATEYQKERMAIIYGSVQGGRRTSSIGDMPPTRDPRATQLEKKTVCDAEGDFVFSNLAAGEYYVTSRVLWSSGQYVTEGGLLASYVKLSPGERKRVLLN